jgi:ABC-2 type transport system permease protein
MNVMLTLLGKDFANLLRNRGALIISFFVPVLLIYIMGQVFGIGRSDSGPTSIPLAIVNASNDPSATKLVEALNNEKAFHVVTEFVNADKSTRPLTEGDLRPLIHSRKFSYALVIPADLISEQEIGVHLKILSDPRNDIESQMVNGLLQKAIFSNAPNLLGKSLQQRSKSFVGAERNEAFNRSIANSVAGTFGGDPEKILADIRSGNFGFDQLGQQQGGQATGESATDFMSKLIRIDQEQVVGIDTKSSVATATRIVGGYAVMFLLFAVAGSSAAFFDEKNSGIFRRLLSAPVSRSQLLWSRFLYGVLFGLGQLTVLFFAGQLLYGVDVMGHLGNLLILCACVAAACTSFGMLLSAITRSAQAANSLATLLVITMSAVGGAWFPISLMPEFMQKIAQFSLVYWAVEGFGSVLWAGESFLHLLPILGVLVAITGVVMTIAIWRFNRSPLFE